MADTLALIYLYDSVVASYAAEDDETPHSFGWEAVPKQSGSRARIIWVPGTPEGEVGEIVAPKMSLGYPARPLANLLEAFHCYIHGFDPTADRRDEKAHYVAARFAFDTWFRHVYNAVHGTFAIKEVRWNPDVRPKEFRHGATILAVGTIQAVIPDSQVGEVMPANGMIDLTQLEVTETVAIDTGALDP